MNRRDTHVIPYWCFAFNDCSADVSFLLSAPAALAANRLTKGAMVGAAVGLVSGQGVNGVLKGAAFGAGVGAMTEDGKKVRKPVKAPKWARLRVPQQVCCLATVLKVR